jgi:hypothetical protein
MVNNSVGLKNVASSTVFAIEIRGEASTYNLGIFQILKDEIIFLVEVNVDH